MVLLDDVAIRTSNHKGGWLKELYHQQALWTEYVVGESENNDILFEAMLYTMDELDAAIFLNLHGFYRQSIGCLRNMLEIVTAGTYLHIYNLSEDLKLWNDGNKKIPFGTACDHLNNAKPIRNLHSSRLHSDVRAFGGSHLRLRWSSDSSHRVQSPSSTSTKLSSLCSAT
jgi:hypothetical protein